jgi:rod shape determining protein RodA
MLLMSGVRRRHLTAIIAVFALLGLVAWLFVLAPYQKDRVTAFLNPDFDPQGKGYNVTQSMIAIGSGNLFGQGLGYGSQSQLRFLPERNTDFIFASAAEELGLVGVVFLLGLFTVMFHRCYRLAKNSRDDFTLFLILGIVGSIAAELIINIGGTLRLLPLTGVTLPFVSYGGSSLLVKFLMIGILESIAVRQN